MRPLSVLPLALLALCALPAAAAAQAGTCELVYLNGPWTSVGDPANRIISAQGPLLVRCNGGEELRADSAVIYSNINEVHLFRQVDYQDPTRSLTSDQAIYNSQTGRLWATGNVVFTDKNRGSTLRGPELEYFRAQADRPESQAIATGRPHLTVTPKREGSGPRRDPMEIDADRITSVGDRHMTGTGNAVIVSGATRSTAEEAYYDATAEKIELRRNARVDGERYDLSGGYIESTLRDGAVEKVVARTAARMESDRLTLTGPQLQLFFERDLLQRTISGHEPGSADSVAAGRSVALARGLRIEGDSLEALSPGQRLRQVNAIGTAQGVAWDTMPAPGARPDSGAAARPGIVTQPPEAIDQKDVLTGDTIIAYFRVDSTAADSTARDSTAPRPRVLGDPPPSTTRDSTARDSTAPRPRVLGDPPPSTTRDSTTRDSTARDSATTRPRVLGEPAPATTRDTSDTQIERLLSIGNARSLYRMRDDSVKAGQKRGGLNYLVGDRIDLTFKDGEVDVARVQGLKQGLYLDPAAARDSAGADTLGADSARAAAARPPAAPPPAATGTPAAPAAPRGTVPAPPPPTPPPPSTRTSGRRR